jgi:hypothetical protein
VLIDIHHLWHRGMTRRECFAEEPFGSPSIAPLTQHEFQRIAR